jgi:2-amino-4-hydroxy-6-hydroxymethyldihydropteridine diphosphokinase
MTQGPMTQKQMTQKQMTEEPVEAVVALGANLGDRSATLASAVRALAGTAGVTVRAVSVPVETEPVGGPGQPPYLNAVAVLGTTLGPDELLERCLRVEAEHGREREERWGPRTLDLDLIAYGRPGSPTEALREDPHLILPHPRAHLRAFVLGPWAQVQPDALLRTPSGVRSVAGLLDRPLDRPLDGSPTGLPDGPSGPGPG